MNEERLRALLREAPVPDSDEAERRGRRLVDAAFEQRQPRRRPTALPRLAIALAASTLLLALLLTPAGAAVRDWIDEALTVGVRDAEPALTEIPGGGALLVGSPEGAWVVQPDGSRRLLGQYAEATWSPRGLFVATASGHMLSAVEPGGTVRWSLSAGTPVADPRWSPSGERIAYRAGSALRVVDGDGTGDRLLAPAVSPVPAVWLPLGAHLLAYVDAERRLRIASAESGAVVASTVAQAGNMKLAWSADGSRLLEVAPRSLRLRRVETGKVVPGFRFGPARDLPLPPGAEVRNASFSPDGGTIAVLLDVPARGARPRHSEVRLIGAPGEPARLLFPAPGRLSELAWSPDGSRLLIGWPEADQWLFIPSGGVGRIRAIGGISAEFAPGAPAEATFPRIDGWCCER